MSRDIMTARRLNRQKLRRHKSREVAHGESWAEWTRELEEQPSDQRIEAFLSDATGPASCFAFHVIVLFCFIMQKIFKKTHPFHYECDCGAGEHQHFIMSQRANFMHGWTQRETCPCQCRLHALSGTLRLVLWNTGSARLVKYARLPHE